MGALVETVIGDGRGDKLPSRIVSRNPATGETLGEVPEQGAEEVRDAVARARHAQKAWAETPVRERARRLLAFRDTVVKRAGELCETISAETGKPLPEAMAMEVILVVDLMTHFAKRAHRVLAPEPLPLHLLKTRASYVHYVPRGVVGIIAPWNFPFSIPVGETVMALLAGNAVVLKPSEITPLVALKAKELYDASGLPPDLFQVVTGRGPTGAALVDAGIDYCAFTGSTATGRKVAAACGERLIPCTMELGGKAAAIVCADADVDRTARALVWGAFANSGQACVSVERVYAHDAVYDELLSKVVDAVHALRQGDPMRGEVDVGAMTWDGQLKVVESRVEQARQAGARVLVGGRRRPGTGGDGHAATVSGLYYEPTVIADCKQDMDVMRQEIFGPVLPFMRVRDEDEAVRLANDSHLALMGYVFTKDTTKGRRLAERVVAGTVMVNDVLLTFAAPETPWAGLKQSGLGTTHGDEGLRALCERRHVNYDRLTLKRELWWYPYSNKLFERTKKALRFLFR